MKRKNPYKRFACWIGWHSYPIYERMNLSLDSVIVFIKYGRCRWCKYEGQIDSQGNLF